MEDNIKKRLKAIGGANLRIKESSKSIQKKHKTNFVEIITQFKEIFIKSNNLHEEYGISLIQYEDQYYKTIELLIFELYGEIAKEIIMWWVYEVFDPKKEDYYILDENKKEKYAIKSAAQLYNILKKMNVLK